MVDMVRAGAPALATSEVPVTGPRPAPEQAPSVLPIGLRVDRVLAFFDVDDAEASARVRMRPIAARVSGRRGRDSPAHCVSRET